MRLPILLALLLVPATAAATDVRVKTQHERARLEGGAGQCFKLAAGELLRGAAIGPGKVEVSLRRLAAPGSPPVAVTIIRDGREQARILMTGKGRDPVVGLAERAAPPVVRSIDIPRGPHTVFVRVGPGTGHVLLAFNEPASAPVPIAERAPEPASPQPASPAPEPPPAADPPRPLAAASGSTAALAAAPPGTAPASLLAGVRAGAAGHLQLGAPGGAVGLSIRWLGLSRRSPAGERGLVLGASVDLLRYQLAFQAPERSGLPALREELTVDSVPILAEAVWSFGGIAGLPVSPQLGLAAGAVLARLESRNDWSSALRTELLPAAGPIAGLELARGRQRLGLDVRWLVARTGGEGVARRVQVGGLLAQASWRVGF
jgi:hypothetical protein